MHCIEVFLFSHMKIYLNGKLIEIEPQASLEACIIMSCPQAKNLVAEINTNIVKKEKWESTVLKDGDIVELIGFVGGG